jgi:dTMP kinase
MYGKIIVIEGTDCSGKGTQSDKLLEKLNREGYPTKKFSFPNYDSPTGKIVGGPYLGKPTISNGWFKEGANNVDPKVASLYYAADRLYNIKPIIDELSSGNNVILDRYTTSNMGHQAGKIKDKTERLEMFKWIEELEYNLLNLPKPDIKVFLYMPYQYSKSLQTNRLELDEHELSEDNLRNAENAYLEMVDLYNFIKIDCVSNSSIRPVEDINNELYSKVLEKL